MNKYPQQHIGPFLATLLIYQLWLAVMLAIYGYNGSFLLLNGLHQDWLDLPMFLFTHLGDALVLTSVLGIALLRKHPALVILLIIVVIITGLTGQFMKNFLFDSWDRPLSVFGENGEVYTVFNYRLFRNSFPSGHSITVAAAVTALVMSLNLPKSVMVLLALVTALVSYTRIYVGVHFAGDVLAGTMLGVAGAMFLKIWLYKRIVLWVNRRSDSGLRRLKLGLFILAVSGLTIGIVMIIEYIK